MKSKIISILMLVLLLSSIASAISFSPTVQRFNNIESGKEYCKKIAFNVGTTNYTIQTLLAENDRVRWSTYKFKTLPEAKGVNVRYVEMTDDHWNRYFPNVINVCYTFTSPGYYRGVTVFEGQNSGLSYRVRGGIWLKATVK